MVPGTGWGSEPRDGGIAKLLTTSAMEGKIRRVRHSPYEYQSSRERLVHTAAKSVMSNLGSNKDMIDMKFLTEYYFSGI